MESSSRTEKSSPRVKEHANKSKRIAVKIPSGRPASNTPSSPNSPSSKEGTAPLIQKRKRSSPAKKTTSSANSKKPAPTKATSFAPKSVAQSRSPIPASSSYTPSTATSSTLSSSLAPLSSGHIPSPDQDDHLSIKKLKVQHSQRSNSQTQSSVQTPKSIPQIVNMQPSPPVNTQPSPIVHTQPSILPTQVPVINLDYDKEQDLQSDVLNLFSNPQLTKSSTDQTRTE